MNAQGQHGVTDLLVAWERGDASALAQLVPVVYDELRRVARTQLAGERRLTLQPTALVHEAYLKLVDQRAANWQNRAHFFAIAARLMRRVIMKRVRRHHAGKRGGGVAPLSLDAVDIGLPDRPPDLLRLDDALARLAAFDPRQAEIVELRFFGGLSVEEVAAALGVSTGTVKREWRTARAWLHKECVGPADHDA